MHLEVNKMFELAHHFFVVRVIRTLREIETAKREKTNGKAGNEKEDEGEGKGEGKKGKNKGEGKEEGRSSQDQA